MAGTVQDPAGRSTNAARAQSQRIGYRHALLWKDLQQSDLGDPLSGSYQVVPDRVLNQGGAALGVE